MTVKYAAAREVKVGSSTPALVRDGTGRQVGSLTSLDALVAVSKGKGVTLGNWQASQLMIQATEGCSANPTALDEY